MLDLLGKGGFACVYRARSKTNGLEVAIKMVRVPLHVLQPCMIHCIWRAGVYSEALTS